MVDQETPPKKKMLNLKTRRQIVALRRRLVSQLVLRGLSQDEIVAQLEENGLINPVTQKGYDDRTIRRDLTALRALWKREAAEDMDLLRARQVMELRHVRKVAWEEKDLHPILRSLGQEATLTGTEAPKKTALTDPTGESPFDLGFDGLRDLLLERLAAVADGEERQTELEERIGKIQSTEEE